jgi:hypothetical protein
LLWGHVMVNSKGAPVGRNKSGVCGFALLSAHSM